MTDTKISKNPLKGYAVVFGIGTVSDASMLWADYLEGRVDAFHAAALLQAIGLLIFYFKRNRNTQSLTCFTRPSLSSRSTSV